MKLIFIASAGKLCHAPDCAVSAVGVLAAHHALLCTHSTARQSPSPHNPPIRPHVVRIEPELRLVGFGHGRAFGRVGVLHALETRDLSVVIEL